MKVFNFIDEVTERLERESLTAHFKLKGDEEFLLDHFNGFPVMPGVLLLETLKQAASQLLSPNASTQYRLVSAEDIKFGQFVKPGGVLKANVRLVKQEGDIHFFDGRLDLLEDGMPKGRALMASFQLVPVRV